MKVILPTNLNMQPDHHERQRRSFQCQVLHQSLQWRLNDHDSVSNHRPHDCLLNRLFRRRSKKTSKLRVTGLCVGNSPGPVNSPHKGPVTRKMFPFDDVIMFCQENSIRSHRFHCEYTLYQLTFQCHVMLFDCLIYFHSEFISCITSSNFKGSGITCGTISSNKYSDIIQYHLSNCLSFTTYLFHLQSTKGSLPDCFTPTSLYNTAHYAPWCPSA